MKKLLAVSLAVCIIFAGFAGWLSLGNGDMLEHAGPAPEQSESDIYSEDSSGQGGSDQVIVQDGAGETTGGLDYGAIYALHQPEDVVMTAGDHEITWDRYFHIYHVQAMDAESYFTAMANYYGLELSWGDMADEDTGSTFAQMVMDSTEEALLQLYAISDFAEENNVELTAENIEAIDQKLSDDIAGLLGEGATEDDFNVKIADNYMTRDTYDWLRRTEALMDANYTQVYGESGEKYSDEAALAWLENSGYMAANHILFLTVDMSTGAALDEEAAAEKLSQARQVLDELKQIDDPERLVARFKELKDELCEDTGKTTNPDGYVFTPGTMVAEFEDAVQALGDYGLSDIVESNYGYHIILRLPLSMAFTMQDGDGPMDVKGMASSDEYGRRLVAIGEAYQTAYADGFTRPNPLDYIA